MSRNGTISSSVEEIATLLESKLIRSLKVHKEQGVKVHKDATLLQLALVLSLFYFLVVHTC
jgi:hypothetical protein